MTLLPWWAKILIIGFLVAAAGVYGGFFEYKMPDEGVFRLG